MKMYTLPRKQINVKQIFTEPAYSTPTLCRNDISPQRKAAFTNTPPQIIYREQLITLNYIYVYLQIVHLAMKHLYEVSKHTNMTNFSLFLCKLYKMPMF